MILDRIKRLFSKHSLKKAGQCVEWQSTTNKQGYGVLVVNFYAHRLSFEITKGDVPEGKVVMHSCDNPICVNPEHLFLGNQVDNVKDRNRKGRQAKGESHGRHKLTQEQVNEIRRIYGIGNTTKRGLAKLFSVSDMTISKIIRNKSWSV